MKRKIEISYCWEDHFGNKPLDMIIEDLDNEALRQIKTMWSKGYISGELNYGEFYGCWELKTIRLED